MRIAFVTSARIWSGVKTWMLEFGEGLQRLGDEVHVFASDPRFLDAVRQRGLAAHGVRFGADYHPATIARFYRAFGRLGIQVMCGNLHKELRTAGIAARLRGLPVIHRVGLPGDIRDRWHHRLTQRWIVTRILVPGESLREALEARLPFLRGERVVCIPNGKRVTGAVRAARHDPVRFVVGARLAPDKRHGDLLQACARLRERGPARFALDVYGEGSQRDALERDIVSRDLAPFVRLRGFVRDLAARLPGYDFGVLPSEREGLSNNLLEYLAAGLPVICAEAGGAAQVVEPGRNGYLYPPGDVDALTALLWRCLEMDDGGYAALSRRAIETIATRFDQAAQVQRFREFCQRLLHAPAAPAARTGRRGGARQDDPA